jgi:hypothetical protein
VFQEIKNIHPNARRFVRSLACAVGNARSNIGKMKQD